MSWESIGSVDTGQLPGDKDWIEFCQKLAIQYIKLVCGEPPPGASLGIMSHDHDLGAYTSIGIYSEYSTPFDYASACKNALDVFDSAISWDELKDFYEEQLFKEDEEEEASDDEDESD